ncbi:MAG: GNAT family N-acetyltransferase [Actinobacteria bacterium HGW-Actinobacteria-4]|nr:MAG: GNAT family N-acetyltransferase [Actinobacteria bacterium HGW-Actinobacteria-4]
MSIRPATAADSAAIARICLLTGSSGTDATGKFCDDAAVSDVYATPYLHGPGGFALVWELDGEPVGYILGTTDTHAFQEWFSSDWWPRKGAGRSIKTADDGWLIPSAADPARMLNAFVDDYPAHLHIDLLPEAQGQGAGRALIEAMMGELRERGVPGVHLETDIANEGANAFYPRVGFSELLRTEGGFIWGRKVDQQ